MSELRLNTDGHIIKFGADNDVSLTHVEDAGLLLNSTRKLQFNDASQFVQGSSATVLSIGATDEIDLTATEVEINVTTLDVNGAVALNGAVTGATNITLSGELDAATLDISGAIDIAGNSQFSGTIKVGAAATPGGTIAITTADSGATAHADADELVMENAGVAGLSILSFNNNYGNIYFGDGQDNDIGKITYLHTDNSMSFTTNTAVGLKIDSIGAVTKPLQPAFHVTNAAQNNLGTDASATITFSTEVFDVNADFNTSNYTFTAPVTGKYMLTFHMTLNAMDSASPFTYAHLDTSNREYYSWYDNNTELSGDAGYVTFHISVLADMDANDTALGKVFIGGGTAQTDLATATNTWFTGFLSC